MNVRELSREQFDELKYRLLYGENDYGVVLTEEQADIVNNEFCPSDIPDEIVFDIYDGIEFVDDDFFCSAGNRNCANSRQEQFNSAYYAVEALKSFKDENPSGVIVIETPNGTATATMMDANIYVGCMGEVVIDSE